MTIKRIIYHMFPNIVNRYLLAKHSRVKTNDLNQLILNECARYKNTYNIEFNIYSPVSFYEKISYLKFFGDITYANKFVDKVNVKKILSNNGDGDKIAKQIKVFRNYVDFKSGLKSLMNIKDFVIKLNHTSSDVWFVHNKKFYDKFGKKVSKKYVLSSIKYRISLNYFNVHYERVYLGIEPSILIEEYLPSNKNKGLDEYKFFCVYGKPVLLNVIFGRQNGDEVKEAFTDPELKIYPVWQTQKILSQEQIYKPKCFDDMKMFCSKYCSSFPFVRVDLMATNDSFRFCEFTFYDCAGFNIFYPLEWNKKLGDLIPNSCLDGKVLKDEKIF